MATKSAVQATITAIADGALNTAAEARAAWTADLNELYSAPIREISSGTLTITTKTFSFCSYDLTFHKVGNQTFLTGNITSTDYSGAVPNQTLITITDSEFFGRSGIPFYIRTDNVTFVINGNTIKCFTALTPLATSRINMQYLNND